MWWAVRHQITLIANQNKKDFSGEEKRKKKKEYKAAALKAKDQHQTLISLSGFSHDVDESEQEKIDAIFEQQKTKLDVEIIDNKEVLPTSKPLVMENFIKTFDTNY